MDMAKIEWQTHHKTGDALGFEAIATCIGDLMTIALVGEIDVDAVPFLKESVQHSAEKFRFMIVDMSNVTFLDSVGVGLLVSAIKRINVNKGKFIICCPTLHIMQVLSLTGINRIIEIYDTYDEAVQAIG